MRALIVMILLAMLVAGCGGGAAVAPTPTPTPAELSARIGQATSAATSLAFSLTVEGAPVYSDASQLFVVTAIDGALRRPDGVLATLRLRSAAGIVEVRTVSLAGKQYATNPLTRVWQCLEPGVALDTAVLFDPERGIEQLLQTGVEKVTLVGEETLDGRAVYHLRGEIAGARLMEMSGGLIGGDSVATDIWADRETLRLAKMVLVNQMPGAEQPTTWTMIFSEYDQPVDVRAPVECG